MSLNAGRAKYLLGPDTFKKITDNLNPDRKYAIYSPVDDSFWLNPEDTYGPAVFDMNVAHSDFVNVLGDFFKYLPVNRTLRFYNFVLVTQLYPSFEVDFSISVNLGQIFYD